MTDPDLVGDFEARLLAVERRSMRLDDDLRTLRRGAIETQQRIRDGWSDWRIRPAPAAAPAACTVNDFAAICPNVPCSLVLNDSFYGDCTLTWDGSTNWHGCAVVTLPNNFACAGPVTFALHYYLTGSNTSTSWVLTMKYVQASTVSHCPAASTCSDPTTISLLKSITLSSCHGTFATSFAASSGSSPGTQAWPSGHSITLGVTFP